MHTLSSCRFILVVYTFFPFVGAMGCAQSYERGGQPPLGLLTQGIEGTYEAKTELSGPELAAAMLEISAEYAKDLMAQQDFAEPVAEPMGTHMLGLAEALRSDSYRQSLDETLHSGRVGVPELVGQALLTMKRLPDFEIHSELLLDGINSTFPLVLHRVTGVTMRQKGQAIPIDLEEIGLSKAPVDIPVSVSEEGDLVLGEHALFVPYGRLLDRAMAVARGKDEAPENRTAITLMELVDCFLVTRGMASEHISACFGSMMAVYSVLQRSVRAFDSGITIESAVAVTEDAEGAQLSLEGEWAMSDLMKLPFSADKTTQGIEVWLE